MYHHQYQKSPNSYYQNYEFVSPQPLYALIKEEFKSYWDAGAFDDLLFPIWTEKCLKKLRKGMMKIKPLLLDIKDFQARLPDDYQSVREAWLCTKFTQSYQLPNADYQTVAISTRLDDPNVTCDLCTECEAPGIVRALYKTTNTILFEYRKSKLLVPGNASLKNDCFLGPVYTTENVECAGTFDVRGNKFVTDFREGVVHLLYYSKEYDEAGYQLIPDNYYIREFIEAFIKFKIMELLSNDVVDETYNQIQQKLQRYDQMQAEKFIIARTETMKEDVYKIQKAIKRTDNRNNKYYLE